MRQIISTTLLFLFFAFSTYAQSPTGPQDGGSQALTENDLYRIDSLMFDHADRMGTAFIEKDFETFADFTYPTIVTALGGKKEMAATIRTALENMEKDGVSFISVSFGQRSDILEKDQEVQCILPQELKMKVPGGTLTVLSYLIALSSDNGHTWHFVDTTDQNLAALSEAVPNLSPELEIPKKEEPRFVAD